MNKTIPELIEEAQALGVDLHDHVAKTLFGEVNAKTRWDAKQRTFCHLYGGTGICEPNAQNSKRLWKLTEEQFKALRMDEPLTPNSSKQTESRVHRVGIKPYKVEVLDDADGDSTVYTIHAADSLDARCMVFILAGGCEANLKHWDDGHIELALTYTRIVE